MQLHIEGKDAAKLMDLIDGMGTLRVVDSDRHIARICPRPIVKTRFYHSGDNPISPQQIVEIDLDWRCFYCREEVVGVEWPRHYSLYCQMKAAMRGLGWSGRDQGSNSISVPDFLEILWRHTRENGFDIRYIETA